MPARRPHARAASKRAPRRDWFTLFAHGMHSLSAMGAMILGGVWIVASLHATISGEAQASPSAAIHQTAEGQARLLAATIWAEARSEGPEGMRAVAHVIVNRVGPRFGDSLPDVIFHPKQFSAWNMGDPNRALALNPDAAIKTSGDEASWLMAQTIARDVLGGRSIDPTGGALFYHTQAVNPGWASHGRGKQVIGAHVFYADVAPRRV